MKHNNRLAGSSIAQRHEVLGGGEQVQKTAGVNKKACIGLTESVIAIELANQDRAQGVLQGGAWKTLSLLVTMGNQWHSDLFCKPGQVF